MSNQTQMKEDFYWTDEREPHYERRKEILRKHPEVKQLFTKNPYLPYSTAILVALQVAAALFIHQVFALGAGWGTVVFIVTAYVVGATASHALFLAIHEITHNLAFKRTKHNNWLAFVANIPLVVPYAMSFKEYHRKHHFEQGKDGVDADIPLRNEAKMFKGIFGKIIWFVHQIIFYAVRPTFVKPLEFDKWMIYNIIFQVAAMAMILPFAGWVGLLYLLLSLLFAGGLHPTSGHFISEHYVFKEGQETYSYYGPLNLLTFNVGHHNEHHDFPNIPGCNLPKLRKMAPEFYENLYYHTSWTKVITQFLFRKDISLFNRIKRNPKEQ